MASFEGSPRFIPNTPFEGRFFQALIPGMLRVPFWACPVWARGGQKRRLLLVACIQPLGSTASFAVDPEASLPILLYAGRPRVDSTSCWWSYCGTTGINQKLGLDLILQYFPVVQQPAPSTCRIHLFKACRTCPRQGDSQSKATRGPSLLYGKLT